MIIENLCKLNTCHWTSLIPVSKAELRSRQKQLALGYLIKQVRRSLADPVYNITRNKLVYSDFTNHEQK